MTAMTQVSIFENTFSKTPYETTIDDMLEAIRDGSYREKVEKIRSASSPEAKRKLKNNIAAFTPSGIFAGGKKNDDLQQHSGFIAVDFDALESDLDTARSVLYADPYTYAGFVSVGGGGLCLLVRINQAKHEESFDALEKYYFTKYGYQADQSCRNVSRLRYLSYDPDLYHNPESHTFTDYVKKPKGRPRHERPIVTTDDDFGHVLRQICDSHTDITPDYFDWLKVGMALKSRFGDSGLDHFQTISSFHPDYDPVKTERKYKSLNPKLVTFSSFFYVAKKYGLETSTPKSKTIKRVASFAKKGGRTPEQAAYDLEKFDNIPPEDSLPVINAVFTAPQSAVEDPDSESDTVHAIEEFVKRGYRLKYNEITKKYEWDDRPMTGEDYNTIYLDTRKIIPRATKELVKAVIQSNRTTNYNPIKDWFTANASRNTPKGLIDSLADSIVSPTQTNEFKRKFVRYWMVGAVAMWHKYHSPLMLVLAGSRQNTGKSHFFRYLLPNELQPYYAESYLTGDKDENIMMCSKILIMNDEMSNKTKRDIAMIKDLCSKQWFNVRKPYGETAEDMRRIAALAGTSNDLALLADPSGNRRIVPINVEYIDHAKYNAIDKADLWVEAYNAFKAGERFHLNTADISLLNSQTSDFVEPSVEMEGFLAFFREPEEHETPQFLTNTQIKSYIEIRTKQRLSTKKLGMELKAMGFNWVKKKMGEKGVVQVYAVTELAGIRIDKFLETE